MEKDIKILAIETSCDETAASVIGVENDRPVILSNIVNSQIELHTKTGGVVPEVASRAHMENIVPVISEALISASQKISNSKFLISNQFLNSNDLNIKNSNLNKNLKLANKNYSNAISFLQNDITHIAVTNGPGLIGSLLVGFNAAKGIAYSLDKPIIPVNHIEGHIYSAFGGVQERKANKTDSESQINESTNQLVNQLTFPILALTVSGGHTSLTLMKNHGEYETIGQTLDDAAGEAFDKVAKLLGLGYPGGPVVSKLASEFRSRKGKVEGREGIIFPRPILNNGTFNFSFSGLKTAVLQKVLDIKREIYCSCHPEFISGSHDERMLKQVQHDISQVAIPEEIKMEICAAFEDAAVDVLTIKTMRVVEKYNPKILVLAGGVAANELLRNSLESRIMNYESWVEFLAAPKNLCGDNAAMIGLAAFYHLQKGNVVNWSDIEVDSNLELNNTDL